jgi:hypothetical protein
MHYLLFDEVRPAVVVRCAAACSPDRHVVALRLPALAAARQRHDNDLMKSFASVLVAALIFGIAYYFYVRKMPTVAPGTAPTQAISLIGVENDLLQIARAERTYVVDHAACGSLEQLVSSGALTMTRSGRDGYTYTVECSGSDFTVRGQHPPAPEGSSIRYPAYTVDQTMQVREGN